MSAPERSAHTSSCSAAAARKVSPAASSTVLPSSPVRWEAILPIVVVLPVPFTPTIRITVGRWVRSIVSPSTVAVSAISSCSRFESSSPVSGASRLQAADDLRGRRRPHVGA